MSEPIRDDRLSERERDNYVRAAQQAAARRQETGAGEESAVVPGAQAEDIMRRVDHIAESLQSLAKRVTRLESRPRKSPKGNAK